MAAYILTPAFDEGGNNRPLHKLEEGDLIEWKRNGETGFRWGRVTCIHHDPTVKRPIRIGPRDSNASHDVTGERERWIGKGAVMRVYNSKGVRKHPEMPMRVEPGFKS